MSKENGNGNGKRTHHNVNPTSVKVGDMMTFIDWGKITGKNYGSTQLDVLNVDTGKGLKIIGTELIVTSFSADQYQEEIKLSKTKVAEILVTCYNRPFTVTFEKQDGTERKLRGRLIQPEPLLGRSMVEDLDEDKKNRVRLVDHRTIKSLIVDGVKYVVK